MCPRSHAGQTSPDCRQAQLTLADHISISSMSLLAQRTSVALGSPSERKQRISVSLAHALAVLCWEQCRSRPLAISTARRYSLDGIPGLAVQAASVGVHVCSLASHWHVAWLLFRALPPADRGALGGACCSLRPCLDTPADWSLGLLVKLARPSSRSSTATAWMQKPVATCDPRIPLP